MKIKPVYMAIVILCVAAMAPPGIAQDEAAPESRLQDLEQKLTEMQQSMQEMERKHQEETQALRDELQVLREQGANPSSESDIDAELNELLRLADEEAVAESGEKGDASETNFIARGLGLQALNPEISIVGDFLTSYQAKEDEPSTMDFQLRNLGIHIGAYLDPYTLMKAAVEVTPYGAGLGEAYVTRFGVLPGLSITAGKFRQQFGVVNRWHVHALDWVNYPMPLQYTFGPEGLNQTGFSFDWMMPVWAGATQEAILQITGGTNESVFGENPRNLPSALLRYKNYRDLSKDVYLELGLTGLFGVNEEWSVLTRDGLVTEDDRRSAMVFGADITLRWEPTDRMRYESLEWRTEFYQLNKGVLAPDGSGSDRIGTYGVYTSLQRQISRTVDVGIRLDWFKADSKSWAVSDLYAPLAVDTSNPHRWLVAPYLTWWQSPWVRVHLEFNYADGRGLGPREYAVMLQIVFSAGPHKHERY